MRVKFFIAILTFLLAHNCTVEGASEWWKVGNFYQIFVRSFKDSNADGIGDLNGISSQLQYIKDIGMDAIMLSPIFQSPMSDFGFDISDYYQIHAEYGTITDLQTLIKNAHRINLKIILDFIPNHTSDKHKWFQMSIKSDPIYKDFYMWHHGIFNTTTGQRQPPSNWLSVLGYSTWTFNEERQEYYLHQFGTKEPELNYRNPAVRKAIADVMNHWLAQGVDGFHIDTICYILEAEIDPATGTYPDEPVIVNVGSCPDPNDYCHLKHLHTYSYPENIDLVYEWRAVVDQFKKANASDTKIILTEADTTFIEMISMYGNEQKKGSHVPYNFELFNALSRQSTADVYRYFIEHWLSNMPQGVPANWFLGDYNHARIATRFGVERVDLMNILLQTLPGIAITYNGEEIGMENVNLSWDKTVDPRARNTNAYIYKKYSRDPQRTPFHWSNETLAGFSTAKSAWLPVAATYKTKNMATQLKGVTSHLKVFKTLTKLRKQEPAFNNGFIEAQVVENVFLYRRYAPGLGSPYIVVLNVGEFDRTLSLPNIFSGVPKLVTVVVSSIDSGVLQNQTVYSHVFVAKASMGYVVKL